MSQFTKGRWEIHCDTKKSMIGIFSEDNEPIRLTESNARLIAEAPVMYDLLNKAFHILGKNTANDAICREIDECLSRVDGVPVQSEKGG